MRTAAWSLVGRHDFASFVGGLGERGAPRSTVRTLYVADWLLPPGSGMLTFEVCADAFLRGMVRTLVGTLLLVGRGRLSAQDVTSILSARDRRQAGPTAPAEGLTLTRIEYPPLSG